MSYKKPVSQYAERDVMELGGYYIRHVIAMTREKLHEKSDIAAELAFRDMRIDEITKQRDELMTSLKELLSSKAEPGLFAGVMAADNAVQLIKSIEDGEWICAGHSPDAGKMVPDGWQLVPVEPTEHMLDEFDSIVDYGAEDSRDAWIRLLSAAPKL